MPITGRRRLLACLEGGVLQERTRGIVKMVADAETSEVLGVTMIGNGAAEVIHEAAMALRFHARLHDFIEQLHVYPTMAEALKIAAIARFRDPARLLVVPSSS